MRCCKTSSDVFPTAQSAIPSEMVSKEGGNGTADPEKGTYGVTMPAVTPLENANVMPGGTRNTAGGKVQQAGFQDALKSIQPGDVMTVHQKPCARQSYMTGMGMGAVVGVLQSIRGRECTPTCQNEDRTDETPSSDPALLQLGSWRFLLWLVRHV